MSSLYTATTRRVTLAGHLGRWILVVLGFGAAALLILVPLLGVYYYALRDGPKVYVDSLLQPDTLHSIWLTLLAAMIAVPLNTVFGLTAAWAISKFEFRGKKYLISIIELPLSISPIVIGVAYLFVFGMQGVLGPWLQEHNIRLIFNVSAIVIVTTMVTTPYVFRKVLPLMQSQGTSEEWAAYSLGAPGWKIFTRITLPRAKWALIYGVTLLFARCLGEFGSVAIISGAIRGQTNTMTLQIDLLFNDAVETAAFAVSSILTSIAVITMLVKSHVERREHELWLKSSKLSATQSPSGKIQTS